MSDRSSVLQSIRRAAAKLRARGAGLPHDRGGATAVEFALVGLPFLFLIFAVMELGLIFLMNISLSNATATIARQIRVGSIVAPGASAASSSGTQLDLTDFKTAICNNIALVPSSICLSQLQVDVRPLSSFQTQNATNPLSGQAFSNTNLCYYSGTPGSVVQMRAYYLWPVVTPLLLSALVNATSINGGSAGNYALITATEEFVEEPNSSITNTGAGC